jgi:hypothetical protein
MTAYTTPMHREQKKTPIVSKIDRIHRCWPSRSPPWPASKRNKRRSVLQIDAQQRNLRCGSMRTILGQRLVVAIPTIPGRKMRKNTHNSRRIWPR